MLTHCKSQTVTTVTCICNQGFCAKLLKAVQCAHNTPVSAKEIISQALATSEQSAGAQAGCRMFKAASLHYTVVQGPCCAVYFNSAGPEQCLSHLLSQPTIHAPFNSLPAMSQLHRSSKPEAAFVHTHMQHDLKSGAARFSGSELVFWTAVTVGLPKLRDPYGALLGC